MPAIAVDHTHGFGPYDHSTRALAARDLAYT